jgi:outer membrane protein OmpA-like peptidoglycan-associated protein/uncharacterized protein YegP (UPF0339 family)
MATTTHDDYLVCGEYQEQISNVSADYPGFITFKHDNGNHYFAWVNGNQIILRSEAYPDAEKMERGIKAVIKNSDLVERYSVDVQHGAHFLVLWGGGDHQKHTGNLAEHNEIGRSCPHKSMAELNALLQFKGADFANSIVKADADVAAPIAPVTEVKETVKEVIETAPAEVKETVQEVIEKAAPIAAAAPIVEKLVSETNVDKAASYSTRVETPAAETDYNVAGNVKAKGGLGWLLPLLGLLLAGGGLWWFLNKDKNTTSGTTTEQTTATVSSGDTANAGTTVTAGADTANAAATQVKGTVDAAGNFVRDLGGNVEIDLPNGAGKLAVGENSTENQLYKMLSDANFKVDTVDKTKGWVSCDRLYFETGKNALTAESQKQIANLAAIMKAFPDCNLKMGGYTDNVGKPESNLKLSQSRAEAAFAALVKLGIDAGRGKAEGYGQEHPIATNDTPEGRAQNRRVDVRITKK